MLLFILSSLVFAQDTSFVEQDRLDALYEVSQSVSDSHNYKLLEQKIEELNERLKVVENPTDPKKNVMKMIGYSSSTIGLITSIWGIYEKSLSLTNSKTELDIRVNTHKVISDELVALKAMEQKPHVVNAIKNKEQILSDLNDKISNIKLRIRISRLGFIRGIFKGISAVGIFTLTLFIDEIMGWIHSKFPPKAIALNFLYEWDVIIYEAGLVHTKYLTPQEKSLFYFADAETLGIPEEEFLKALEIYRQERPDRYKALKSTAIAELTKAFNDFILKELFFIQVSIDSLDLNVEDYYYIAEPDGTYVNHILFFK